MKTCIIMTIMLLSSVSSCLNRRQFTIPVDEDIRRYYNITLEEYPQELVDHLPEWTHRNIVRYAPGNMKSGRPVIRLLQFPPANVRKEVTKMAKENAIAIYDINAPCLMIIRSGNEKSEQWNDGISRINIEYCESEDLLPISDLKFTDSEWVPDKFFEKAKIYVLDAKPGKYLPDDYLPKQKIELPPKWEHGYSKGVIIYNDIIGYWIEIW